MTRIDLRPGQDESLGATVATNAVETISRYGAAALMVMNPEICDHNVRAQQRGHTWDQADPDRFVRRATFRGKDV